MTLSCREACKPFEEPESADAHILRLGFAGGDVISAVNVAGEHERHFGRRGFMRARRVEL